MVETAAFEAFWKTFPRHVGKLAALKAYTKARTIATAEEILDGVERYKRTKPPYADWCFPATFLNQGRWMDEPDIQVKKNHGPSERDLELIAEWERSRVRK